MAQIEPTGAEDVSDNIAVRTAGTDAFAGLLERLWYTTLVLVLANYVGLPNVTLAINISILYEIYVEYHINV